MDGKHGLTWFTVLIYYIIGSDFSQKDFVCFDFVPRHHNIIRYRKGQPMIIDTFATVCAWNMFNDDEEWKYDLMIGIVCIANLCMHVSSVLSGVAKGVRQSPSVV